MNPALRPVNGRTLRCMVLAIVLALSLFCRLQLAFLTLEGVRRMRKNRDSGGLVNALTHADPDIQYEAVEGLGDLRNPATAGPLMELFTAEGFTGVRWKVAEALTKIGEPAVDPLIAALSHPDDDVRWKAAIALGDIRDSRAIDPLIRLLADPDRFVKGHAALALGAIGEPAVDPLIRALETGDGSQRWGAAIALGKIKDPRTVVPLIRALGDKYENVRGEAAGSLAAIGTPAVRPLIAFLKFADRTARAEVLNTLADLQAEEAIEPIVQLLERADEDERRTIAGVLDEILTPSAEALAKRLWNSGGNENTENPDAGR